MPRHTTAFAAALLAVSNLTVTILPIARAETPRSIGRYCGIGWSDGYHSRTACPPKPHQMYRAAPISFASPAPPIGPTSLPAPTPAASLPWWKVHPAPGDASGAEPLSTPAASQPGPSLFRQPGEGSSVIAPSGPQS